MTLLYELTQGSLAAEIAPYIASADDETISAILNRKDIPVYGVISGNTFSIWAASNNLRATIEDVSLTVGHPLRSIALTLLDLIKGNLSPVSLDFSNPINVTMMNYWIDYHTITIAQRDELLAKSIRLISKAEEAGIAATALDIRREIWSDDGSRKL